MSRRHRGQNPISLFAFQDIITSVSGIFIVMVLLLTLELVERSSAGAPPAEAALAADVQQATVQAERELAALQGAAANQDQLLREVAEFSPEELREAIAARQREIPRLEAELEQARARSEALQESARSAAVEQFDLRDEREELERLQGEIAQTESQVREDEQSDRPVFTLPRGFAKQGWLVVLEAEAIAAAPLDRPARPTRFQGEPGVLFDESPAEQLVDWAGKQSRSVYLMMLIRPDGIEAFDEAAAELDRRGIEYGFDLVTQDQELLHPQRGAAP